MPLGLGSFLAGGSSLFGGLLGTGLSGLFSMANQAISYKNQKKLLQMQMDWMEEMSNTAHQREVDDLREAGLNPILSAMGGSGASSPSVSAPSVQQAHPLDVSGIYSAAKEIGRLVSGQMEAQIAKDKADANKATAQAAQEAVKATNAAARGKLELEQMMGNVKSSAQSVKESEARIKAGFGTPNQAVNIINNTQQGISKLWDSFTGFMDDALSATAKERKARDMERNYNSKAPENKRTKHKEEPRWIAFPE